MAIISSVIVKQQDRGNGSLRVFEQHTDDLTIVHEHRYHCPVGYDTAQALIDYVPILEESLRTSEAEAIKEDMATGGDPNAVVNNYITVLRKDKSIARGMMRGLAEDVYLSAVYVEALSDTRLGNMFDAPTVIRIRDRQSVVISNNAAFIADEDSREDLEE